MRTASQRWVLPAILLVALALRLATLAVPSFHHPDEIYQYLEAAHRIVFGYGIVPWEYRAGMRSWLLPLLLSGPMALGGLLAPTSGLYLLLPRLAMIAVSTSIVGAAWMLGARVSRAHAVVAAIVTASWYEFVAIAAHPLGESIGLATACGAAALAFGTRGGRARLVTVGALLALTCVLRFQYGPAMLVLAAFAGGRDARGRWLPMAAGAAAVLVLSAVVDLAFGATPFFWLIENVRQNVLLDKAAGFGTAPVTAYIGVLGNMWGWASVPIVIAAYVGAKRHPALACAALTHLVLHSLIGHKEYRFILLTSGFAIILAAIGTVDLVDAARQRLARTPRTAWLLLAVLAWGATSAMLALDPARRPLWTARAAAMTSMAALHDRAGLCGIGILGVPALEFGGYTALHRHVPIYLLDVAWPDQRAAAARHAAAFDTILATPPRVRDIPAGYRREGCQSTAGEYVGTYLHPEEVAAISAICTYRRTGTCSPDAARAAAPLAVNRAMRDHGM